eukprot:864924-Pleurochrysis_carterae.AAC.1
MEQVDPVNQCRQWFQHEGGFRDLIAQQQLSADLLPFPEFHIPDINGRVGSNPSHAERALEYGTPSWSSA